jgi:hypothetical protein
MQISLGRLGGPVRETYIKANTATLINDLEADEKNKNSDVSFNSSEKTAT